MNFCFFIVFLNLLLFCRKNGGSLINFLGNFPQAPKIFKKKLFQMIESPRLRVVANPEPEVKKTKSERGNSHFFLKTPHLNSKKP